MLANRRAIDALITVLLVCGIAWAGLTTEDHAKKVVEGWLTVDATPLDTPLGRQVAQVKAYTSDDGQVAYYIVSLKPNGFVIVPGDDGIEPIVGFVDKDTYDPSIDNPLGALVTGDLNARIAGVRGKRAKRLVVIEAQKKWDRLISLSEVSKDESAEKTRDKAGIPPVDDVRVTPLLQSKWWQRNCCPESGLACYNYYTPPFTTSDGDPCNYVCGCVATASAQIMRYHEHPKEGVGVRGFTIRVDGTSQTAYTRGGDGAGGPYNWSDMAFVPDCNTTETERKAIGALCYDAGVAVGMSYTYSESARNTLRIKDSLTSVFHYGNAIKGYNSGQNIGTGLIEMINPNLDAKDPVVLRVAPGPGVHAIVCDGYGYSSSTLYHHVNMGWGGIYDGWYNLPILEIDPYPAYTSVTGCIYNIHVTNSGDGEMISGRVLDRYDSPIVGTTVSARIGEQIIAEAETDNKGIYAFDSLESNTTYTLVAEARGYGFQSQEISTGISTDLAAVSGNVWGVDFVGLKCDYDCDGMVNFKDLAILAQNGSDAKSAADVLRKDAYKQATGHDEIAAVAENWLTAITIPPLPSQAEYRSPANSAVDIDIDTDLSWTPGLDAQSHDVCFGKTNPPVFVRNQTETTFDPGTLEQGPTYYWRIDQVNRWGRTRGVVWSFTTVLPEHAWDPSPEDGAQEVSLNPTLRWKLGSLDPTGYALSYDVFVGNNEAAVANATTNSPEYEDNVASPYLSVANLQPETVYFWRVDTRLKINRPPFTSTVTTGNIWSFATEP